ncbi:hypothetical protein [Streptomyces sp. NPDC047043]|uniref:hypothetical protein n=1 Tax=Streptomyces sp. NPDC047043 TaxID=3154497 RepID=UPI00340B874C
MTGQRPPGHPDFTPTAPGTTGTAWADPATRGVWRRQTGRSLLFLAGHAAGWTLYIGSSAVREHLIWLCVVFALFSVCRVPVEVFGELMNAMSVRRVLRAHPWHIAENPPHGLSDHPQARNGHNAWFEVPDPADPERRVPLIIDAPLWWVRRMRADAPPERKARMAVLWYSGIPGEEVVIAASRADERTPHRLRHRHLRHSLMPETPARTEVTPPPGPLNALSHPATRRAMRHRTYGLVTALLLIWPTVLFVQIAEVVADEDHDKVGLFGIALLLELTFLPLHVFLIVAARRMARTLATNSWRMVDCTIRRRGRQQLIRIGDRTLTTPPSSYVDSRLTRLWIAGHPHRRCVISAPGGAEPLRVAMSTTDNRNP